MSGVALGRDKAETQQVHVVRSATISATVNVDGPVLPYAGRVWDSLWVTVTTAVVPGTDNLTFQPQYHLEGSTYTVGTGLSTTTRAIAAGRAFRCHDEALLNFRIPEGATLSVKVTRAAGSLVNPAFSFVTVGG